MPVTLPRFLPEATDEQIASLTLKSKRNLTLNDEPIENQARWLLFQVLLHLKTVQCWGRDYGYSEARIFVQQFAYSERMKALVLAHVDLILRYGWFVYGKLHQRVKH